MIIYICNCLRSEAQFLIECLGNLGNENATMIYFRASG